MSDKATYQQQAYDYIKQQIMTLGHKPGEVITDSQIARELQISRTPVREAFYRLENEGLLINDARRGWRVYSLSIEDIREIFEIKAVVEGMIAGCASQCADETLRARLRATVEDMRRACDARDSEAWRLADFALHDILFEMANNDRAHRIIDNLNDQWHRVRIGFIAMQGRMHASTAEHEEFVAAILAGQSTKAEALMRAHLNNVREELERLLVNLVLPFVQRGI